MLPICNNKLYVRKKKVVFFFFSFGPETPRCLELCAKLWKGEEAFREERTATLEGRAEGGLTGGVSSTGESQSKATLAPARFSLCSFFLLLGIAQRPAHDRRRRGRNADTAGWFAAFPVFYRLWLMQIKFYLCAEERFSKKQHFLKQVRSQGQRLVTVLVTVSRAHAITSYPERRGKHVLMEHSEDCLSNRKTVL